FVCERMPGEFLQHFIWNRRNIRTAQRSTVYMTFTPDRCRNDFRIYFMKGENIMDIFDQVQPFETDVIQPSDERRYISRTGTCCSQRLNCIENKRDIRFDTLLCKYFDSFHTLCSHGNLNDNMLMKFGKLPSFGNHAFRIKCDDLTADRTTDKLAYFNETVMERDPFLLGYK